MPAPQKRKTAAKTKSSSKNAAPLNEPPSKKKKQKLTEEEYDDVEMDVDEDSPDDRHRIVEADVAAAEKEFEEWKKNGGTFDVTGHMRRCSEDLDKVCASTGPSKLDNNEINGWHRRLERIIKEHKELCAKQEQLSLDRPPVLSNDLMHKVFSATKVAPMHTANGEAPVVIASSSTISLSPPSPFKSVKTENSKKIPSQKKSQSKPIRSKTPEREPSDSNTTSQEEQGSQNEQAHQFKKQWYRSMSLLTILLMLGIALIAAAMMTSKTPPTSRSKLPIDPQSISCYVMPSGRQECFDKSTGLPVAIPATRDEVNENVGGSNEQQPTVEKDEDATFISESVEEPYPEANVETGDATPVDNVVSVAAIYSDAAYAASSGDLEQLQSFLDATPDLMHTSDSNGWTLLHEAARMGHTHVVEYLIHSRGANVEARTTQGQRVLDIALYKLMDESHPTIVLLKQVMGMFPVRDDVVVNDPSDTVDDSNVVEPADVAVDAQVVLEVNPAEPDASEDDATATTGEVVLDTNTGGTSDEPLSIPDNEGESPALEEPLEPNLMDPGASDVPTDEVDDGDDIEEEIVDDEEEEANDEEAEATEEEDEEEEEELPLGLAQELVANGDAEELKTVLESYPDLIYEVDPTTGYTLLHMAAQYDHTLDCMRVLLDAGVDPLYSPDDFTGTALDVAMAAHPHNMHHPIIVMLQEEAAGSGDDSKSALEEAATDETGDVEATIREEDPVGTWNENAPPVGVEIPSQSNDELLAEALREYDATQQG
jgi:ankyrin repeat protein